MNTPRGSDPITELLDGNTAPKLPPSVMLIEQGTGPNSARVVDEVGRLRYTVVHPHWLDSATGQYVKASAAVVAADQGDGADYKTLSAVDKYGFAETDWIIGIKTRADDRQYLTKPYALTRGSGKQDNEVVAHGIYEWAQPATAFGQEEGRAAKWDGIFRDVQIRAEVSDGGGLSVRHAWRKEAVDGSEWYGVIWEVNCKALDYLALIQEDGPHGTWLQPFVTEDGRQCIVEYFPAEEFEEKDEDGKPTGALADVRHEYTTLSGGLGANLDLARGSTYYATANVTLGAYNVTSSGSSGRWTVKTTGAVGFQVNSTGTFVASYGDFTSKNDNTRGETIAGSSGTPATGDQTVGYILCTGTSTTSVSLTDWSARYCTVTNQAVIGWNASAVARSVTLATGTMQYNTIASGSSAASAFIGRYGATVRNNGLIVISDLSIDSTNTCSHSTLGFGLILDYLRVTGSYATRVFYNAAGTHMRCLYVSTNAGKDFVVISSVFHADAASAVVIFQSASGTVTDMVVQSIIRATGNGNGVSIAHAGGTLYGILLNNIIMDCDGAGAVGLSVSGTPTVTHTYNIYYNNTTNCFEALHDTESTGVDPQLGNLPAGATIAAGFTIPDGYAVRNPALEFGGSGTYDSLGIDPAQYSATGWRYAGTKNITRGVQYQLSTFPEAITGLTPNSGTTAGGTPVAWAGSGFGATQGTGKVYLDGVEQTVTAWADDGPDISTVAHAAGAVTASCTNYRGAVFSLPTAFTFEAQSADADSILDLGACSLIWREPPNWRDGVEQHSDAMRDILEMSGSTLELLTRGDLSARSLSYRYLLSTKAEEKTLLDWVQARRGRLQRFWLPAWRNDFTLAEDVAPGSDTVVVEWCGMAAQFQGHERIFFHKVGGYLYTRHVVSAVDNGDGTETLTLDSACDFGVLRSSVDYFGLLLLVRLDVDAIEVRATTADVAEVTLPFTELAREYAVVDAGGDS